MPPLDPEDSLALSAGPCQPWPVEWCACDLHAASPAVTGFAVEAATEVLWGLSGRQFGECAATVRPCRQDWAQQWDGNPGWASVSAFGGTGWVTPYLFDGQWFNVACGQHFGGGCGCTAVEQVIMPGSIARVDRIVIDGVVLDPSAYRLDNRRILIRQDGGRWPLCQDYSKPSGQPGTWTIDFVTGEQVPGLGQLAMGELACEFVKACVAPSECALPRRVAELTRQGVHLKFVNALRGIDRATLLMLGLTNCHLFLETFNPGRLQERARVWSPDIPDPRYMAP